MTGTQIQYLMHDVNTSLRTNLTKAQSLSDADKIIYEQKKLLERCLEAIEFFVAEAEERCVDECFEGDDDDLP